MKDTIKKFSHNKDYVLLFVSILVCFLGFGVVSIFEGQFSRVMGIASYLAWHNLFEFASVLVSLAVFLVAYFTYNQTRDLRSIFIGSIFLTVGILDALHTLSYKGMPAFFIENYEANRATTLWIISRLIASSGSLAIAFMPQGARVSTKRRLFLIIPVLFSIIVFFITTYYPQIIPPMFVEGSGLTRFKILMEYLVVFLFFMAFLKIFHEYKETKNRILIYICIFLAMSIFSELAFVLYLSVYDIYNYLGHIYKFVASFFIFKAIFIKDVQQPYHKLYKAKQKIGEYAANLDKVIQDRTYELTELNEKLLKDLEYARNIQKAIFTPRAPSFGGVVFEAKYCTAERVGGDFYNIFRLDKENVGFYIGDVSGHGVPAAMLAVFLNQTIKTLIEMEANSLDATDPSKVLGSIYKTFNDTNFSEDVYIVMLYAVYNTKTRNIKYSSAGLNVHPILMRAAGKTEEIEMGGFPICKFIEYFDGEYKNYNLNLRPGERLVFSTDGLVEAQDFEKNFFGSGRLRGMLEENHSKSPKELADLIMDTVFNFVGNSILKDDITFIIMDVSGEKGQSNIFG